MYAISNEETQVSEEISSWGCCFPDIGSNLTDVVLDVTGKYGVTAVAAHVGCNPSAISRFKNNETGLKMSQIDKILQIDEIMVISAREYDDILRSFITAMNLLQKKVFCQKT